MVQMAIKMPNLPKLSTIWYQEDIIYKYIYIYIYIYIYNIYILYTLDGMQVKICKRLDNIARTQWQNFKN